MPVAEREKRRQWLEAHPLEWIKELFPRFAKYDFAGFQKKAIARIIRQATEGNWYEVLSWARELSKSTTVMFVVMYLALTGRKRNILLTSNSSDNAERLLRVYRAQLEANKRIAFYYGNQRGTKWTEEHFITARGVSFFAVGARQSPPAKLRRRPQPPPTISTRMKNAAILKSSPTNGTGPEQALYFTRSFSEPLLVIWCGNIIARDCCIARAGARARELAGRNKPLGNWDIINIRMVDIRRPDPKRDFAEGVSVWPEKNTEAMIDEVPLRRCRPPRCKRNASTTQWLKGRTSKRSHGAPCPRLISFPSLLVMATRRPPIVRRTARA